MSALEMPVLPPFFPGPDDIDAFLADLGFDDDHEAPTPPPALCTSPEEDQTSAGSAGTVGAATDAGAGGDRERLRRLRRRISNRESARRSRTRKQRHLEEQRATEAALRAGNRDLAARLRSARARAAAAHVANARLRSEAHALSRRLAAARRALALRLQYLSSVSVSGAGGLFDMQQTAAAMQQDAFFSFSC
ncbi:ocs element-binding factor 1 [Brachypodium distachyon]|uniref:ocs element-binding factor 1 n=1 Tax=Brachypodium distachyon TaxID=15368 RepID=UPI0001C7058D|nr:ocs element-binding factor 1 [Brachypodium distachyon]|eukprot:XP_003579093.2 ocs element-binding factor 1 [Brachypodium distachyon]